MYPSSLKMKNLSDFFLGKGFKLTVAFLIVGSIILIASIFGIVSGIYWIPDISLCQTSYTRLNTSIIDSRCCTMAGKILVCWDCKKRVSVLEITDVINASDIWYGNTTDTTQSEGICWCHCDGSHNFVKTQNRGVIGISICVGLVGGSLIILVMFACAYVWLYRGT